MKVAIIGGGNMGMAFARSFIQYELVSKENLLLIEKDDQRAKELADTLSNKIIVDKINEKISEYDVVILAVKPQDFPVLAEELKHYLRPELIVLSVMAGIPIRQIQQHLSHAAVVRAMPNTPAKLGIGMTGFTPSKEIELAKLFKLENLLNATGRSVYIEDENMLDAVTALSGSGPAYFYYFVKQLVAAAQQMGFDEGSAMLFVKQTMLGAYHLINTAEMDLDMLIKAVASKGGTTEAALAVFEKNKLGDTIIAGVLAAEKRAKELSGK